MGRRSGAKIYGSLNLEKGEPDGRLPRLGRLRTQEQKNVSLGHLLQKVLQDRVWEMSP